VARGRHVRTREQRGGAARGESGRDAFSECPRRVGGHAGVENVNAQVDALIAAGALRRVLAFTELTFSNSMIEA
jgi:hypothetical protein